MTNCLVKDNPKYKPFVCHYKNGSNCSGNFDCPFREQAYKGKPPADDTLSLESVRTAMKANGNRLIWYCLKAETDGNTVGCHLNKKQYRIRYSGAIGGNSSTMCHRCKLYSEEG